VGGRRWCIWVRRRFDGIASLVTCWCGVFLSTLSARPSFLSRFAVEVALFSFSVECSMSLAPNSFLVVSLF
jgi:hypothetical protein